MADRTANRSIMLVADACLRLLVLLTATFLVYEIALRTTEAAYHPLYRYWQYLRGLLLLQPGVTPHGVKTAFFIRPALVRTLALFAGAMAASVLAGYLLARWNFVRYRERAVRRLERIGSLAYSLPIAVLAMLFFIVASETGWFPVGGTSSARFDDLGPAERAVDLLRHYFLPWLTLTLFPALLLVRSGLLIVRELRFAEYVTIARSHGLSPSRLFAYHIRRPLLARLLSDLAANLPLFVTYLVIVELAYRYTGIGFYTVQPYTGVWGMRREEAFTVAQAALVYIGAVTVLLQLVFRLGGLWLVPSHRTADTDQQAQITRTICAGVAVMLLGAFLYPPLGTTSQAAVAGRIIAGAAATCLVGLLIRRRGASGVGRPPVPEIAMAPGAEGSLQRPPARGWFDRIRPGTVIVCACVCALVVLPWLLPPPERPPVQVMFRPNLREHPVLIWYYFLRTLVEGRFLLVVLVAAFVGSSVGSLLGIVAGYFRSHTLDRAMAYVHVFPSILVVVLVVGLSEVPGLPVFVALVVAAAVRFFADSRDYGVVLRKTDFVRYGVSIGEGPLEQLSRHVLPNLARGYGARLLDLSVDLIVLTANLSFLRLLPAGPGAPAAGAEGLLRFAAPLTDGWGRLLADARSDFIKGIYLPALWPFVLLIGTIFLVRALAARWEAR